VFRDPPRRFARSRNMKEWMSLAQRNTLDLRGGSPGKCMIRQSVSGLAKGVMHSSVIMQMQIQARAAGFNLVGGDQFASY
jgi:hypothetical protein